MRFNAAFLADAASVREGLLHVLGGGVARVGRPLFPAPLDCVLVAQLSIPQDELRENYQLTVTITDDEGKMASQLGATFAHSPFPVVDLAEGEDAHIPMVLPTAGMVLPHPGLYHLTISIPEGTESDVTFYAWDLKTTAPFPGVPTLQG